MPKPPPREREVTHLARVLTRHYAHLKPVAPPSWMPPHRVLDVALAVDLDADAVRIERARYTSEVGEPVEAFRKRYPGVATLADLRARLAPDPEAFARNELGVDPRRGPVALALVGFLLGRLGGSVEVGSGREEAERLAEAMSQDWTHWTDYDDVASEHVGAHGLAYLQMRLGAEVVVPEPVVFALRNEAAVAETAGGEGDEATVAEAIRLSGLPPLAVLQALRADWVRGRAWSVDPPAKEKPEVWPVYLRTLAEAVEDGRWGWNAVVALHRAAPYRPGGLDAAARGDAFATFRALSRQGQPSSFAAVADATLRACYLDADGQGFDAEAAFEAVHAAAHDLARDLRATGGPPAPDVLGVLRALFDLAARRTTRHWWRRAWDN